MIKALVMVLFLIAGTTGGVAYANIKEIYRPYAHGFPQIIQEFDYPTIEAVETLFVELKKLPKGDITCNITKESIVLRHQDGSMVTVSVFENGPIVISQRPYKSKNTLVLFTTLKKLLSDLSRETQHVRVQYEQFSTRAYRKRTIVEFDFGPKIVVLDAFSNGRSDKERLYILDIVDRKESFFWGNKGR